MTNSAPEELLPEAHNNLTDKHLEDVKMPIGSIPKKNEERLAATFGKWGKTEEAASAKHVVAEYHSLADLHGAINATLEKGFSFIAVVAELNSFSISKTSNAYFTLKDGNFVLNAVCFKGNYNKSMANAIKIGEMYGETGNKEEDFFLQAGQLLRCEGELKVYPVKGELQLQIDNFVCVGWGSNEERLKRLTQQLEREGLFLPERKKAIPFFVKRIALITSAFGAVRHDFTETLKKIFPHFEVLLFHIGVEDDALGAIKQLEFANEKNCDVAVLARGGGTKDDLRMWNEERLVRFLADYSLSTISAIGHESDDVLVDRVCDLRVSTPTQAAEKLAIAKKELLREVIGLLIQSEKEARFKVEKTAITIASFSAKNNVLWLQQKIKNSLFEINNFLNRSINSVTKKITSAEKIIQDCAEISGPVSSRLALLHGFADVSKKEKGAIVRVSTAKEIIKGNSLSLRFADGEVDAQA